jgi:hypothetical protein
MFHDENEHEDVVEVGLLVDYMLEVDQIVDKIFLLIFIEQQHFLEIDLQVELLILHEDDLHELTVVDENHTFEYEHENDLIYQILEVLHELIDDEGLEELIVIFVVADELEFQGM